MSSVAQVQLSFCQNVAGSFVRTASRHSGVDIAFLTGATPVLGAVPSAILMVYTLARAVDRAALCCIHGITSLIVKNHKTQFQEVKHDFLDYCALFAAATVGTCTLGLSNYLAIRIAFPNGIGCGGKDL